MKVTIIGYGHFAMTVATALALRGHEIEQFDMEPRLIRGGQIEKEPHWPPVEIVDVESPSDDSHIVWIAYDTPLDDHGRGDTVRVAERVCQVCSRLRSRQLVLLSSQWPVGTAACIARYFPSLSFAYVVENIRVGHALEDFSTHAPIIVGTTPRTTDSEAQRIEALLKRPIEWMSMESAEFSKHALNTFLALQIAFANELDTLAKQHGADGQAIYRALITDRRVSTTAPLKPGGPFGGGSLQRDVITLNELAAQAHLTLPIIAAILPSNNGHRP